MLRLRFRARLVDVDVETEARRVCLFGPSGSGKTTCLDAVAGLLRPRDGEIRVGDRTLFARGAHLPPRARGVGYLPQDAPLFPHLSVRDNLRYGDRGADPGPIAALLGIADLLDRMPHALSGGERRRAALGRALLARPRVLLLDEPFAGLDAPMRARLFAQVARLDVPHLVLVSHDPRDALGLADEVVVLDKGRVARRGPPAEVFGPSSDLVEPAAVLEGRVTAAADPYATVDVDGLRVDAHLPEARVGETVRLGLRADELTLSLRRHDDLSARNQLPGAVVELRRRGEQVLAVLDCGPRLLALVEPRSVEALRLEPGSPLVAQFKASSLKRAGL